MKKLELKIPPIAVLIVVAFSMWGSSFLLGDSSVSLLIRCVWLAVFIGAGAGVAVSGVMQFKKAQTSFSPMNPDKASSVVSSGIFAYTRNPMYVGMAVALIGVAGAFGHWQLFAWVLFFVGYLTQFQIKPEERMLREKFGTDYSDYTQRVRRWL